MPRAAIVTDEAFTLHAPAGFHPEGPERLTAALRALEALGPARVNVAARVATTEELARIHTSAYLSNLEAALRVGQGYLDADTYFGPATHEAAWRAAGGACALVEALLEGRAEVGALLARPPGHHATPTRAMGFCLLNNVAIGAAHARSRGLARVAVVDWDVHHGNGTQAAFESDPSVLFASIHQWPLYPGTGASDDVGKGDARGTKVNVPLPPGAGGAAYRAVFEQLVLPVLEAYRPELILVSAGYDAHARDPLGSMRLEATDYAWMAARLRDLALRLGHGRVALVLEGGYDLHALEQSIAASMRALIEPRHIDAPAGEPAPEEQRALHAALRAQRSFWPGVL